MMERKEIYRRQQAFEQELATYTGSDPLKLRYDFISWLDGNYGKENVMDVLVPVLEETLKCFWNASQYQQDSRFIQILITYISMQTNPTDIYKSVYDKGTGTESPIFYSSWANTYAERENFKKANEIFNLGLSKVISKSELEKSYEQFLISLGKKFLQLSESDNLQSIFPKNSNSSPKNQTNPSNASNDKDDIFEWALNPLKVGDLDTFKCPGVVHDLPDPNKISMYPKNLVYGGDKEYSMEEIMATYYEEKLKQKEEEARNLTKDIKDELEKGEVKADVAMNEHPVLEVDNENEKCVNEILDQENAGAHVAENIVQNHITPHKNSAAFPKPLLLYDSLTISQTSYTAHMKEAMNVVQKMWSSPTPAVNSGINAQGRTLYKNTAAEPPTDSHINNENGGAAQLPTRTSHFAIYTEEDNEVENCVPTPQECAAIIADKRKAMTSVKKDSLLIRKFRGKSNAISERKPKENVEIQDFEKRASTNRKQLPFSNASEDNRDFLATKLENITIVNPAANNIKINNIKPLLPADPEDNISNETCNTEAFNNFSLPTSTPIQNKIRATSNRVSVESQGGGEDQVLGKSKNPGELSMILEASKERYSNSSSSNGCAFRGQSSVPLHSVTEDCYPSKPWHSFLISNSIPRSSVSKHISKLSPIKERFCTINDKMKSEVINNEWNIVENEIKEETNHDVSLELTLTGERNLCVDENYNNTIVNNSKEATDSELIKITEILNSLCKYVASEIARVSCSKLTLEDENHTILAKCAEQTVNTSISLIDPKDQLFSVVNKQLVSNNKTGEQTRSSLTKNSHTNNQIHELEDPSLTGKGSNIEMNTKKNVKLKRGRKKVYVASEIARVSCSKLTLEDENHTILTAEQTVNTSISLIDPKDQLFSVVNKQLVSNNKTGVQTRSSFTKNSHNNNQIHRLEDPSLTGKGSNIEMNTKKNVKLKRGRKKVYVASEIARVSCSKLTLEDENHTILAKCAEQTVNTSISLINPKDQLFSVVNKQLASNNKTGVQTRSSFTKNSHNNNQIHELEDPSLTGKGSNIEMNTKKNVKPKMGRKKVQSLLGVQTHADRVSKRLSTCSDLQMDRKRSESGVTISTFGRRTDDSSLLLSNTITTKGNTINKANKTIIESKTIKANILKESNQITPSNHDKSKKSKTTVKNRKSSKKLQNKNELYCNCSITAEQNKRPKRCTKKSNNENYDNNKLDNVLKKLSINNEVVTNKRYSEKSLNKSPALDVNRGRRRSNRLLNLKNKDVASKGIMLDQDVDPFCPKLLERLLNGINFPQTHHAENYFVSNNSLPLITKTLQLGNDIYTIAGDIGKGAYARIVKATVKNRICALKVEKPACKWEHYICREIQKRVAPAGKSFFMDIKNAYIFNGGSILETEWAQYGTLLNLSNQYKIATGKLLDNPIILHFAIELIDIIDYLHQCNIIHADIKPDNFVVRSLPNLKETRSCVQLIDFGRSIDMRLLPPGTHFTTVVKTEGFTCTEMKERKPWTYQTDLYGVLSTIHCLIIGEYMMVEKKDNEWKLYKPLPRTVRKVWDPIFTCLLNIESCEKLPSLVVIKAMLEEALSVKDKYLLAQNYRTLENIFKGK